MRTRKVILVASVLVLAVVAASCSSGSSSSTTPSTTAAAVTSTTSAADAHTVTVIAGDINGLAGIMTYTASTATVKAGDVTFVLQNVGTIEHELVVLKTDTPFDQLAIDGEDRVDEADSVGEVAETAAGVTDSVVLNLTPGNYVLVCNIGGHYRLGMRIALTVTA